MKKDPFIHRINFFRVIFILIWFALAARLFSIQVLSDKYKKSSAVISIREEVVIPARGVIRDRNGIELVTNDLVFDLMVIGVELKPFDTMMLCNILGIDPVLMAEQIAEQMKDPYKRVNRFTLARQIPPEQAGVFFELQHRFPGFYIQPRTLRRYPRAIAAHTLGYIGEVNQRMVEQDSYYLPGDYIGISGIEKSYEEILRGKKGIRKILKDKFSRNQGPYLNGREDIEALAGEDLYISIDADLQEYGEMLMQNKIGSIVAIEPSSGEILALVTSPTYDPNKLSGQKRAKNYHELLNDKYKPLMNRALQAQYPPGSTFKVVNALIGEQMGVLKAETRYGCSGGFHMGGLTVRCHGHPGPTNLAQSIQHSCNAYYCYAFRDMLDRNNYPSTAAGFEVWRNHALSFGLGERFDNDLPYGNKGNIPTAAYYDRYHGKGRWKALTVISLAIGQGEVLTTPLQLANVAAIIANRGHYVTPHIVKAIGTQENLNKPMMKRHQTTVDPAHYDPVIRGMRDVVLAGTARNAHMEHIAVCGKTGTAQNPHGANHSLFIAYAPMENPKIAIAVIVENSGYGSTWASPIASLMIEKFISGEITRPEMETRMKNGKLL
jgi:penicillin-binding protein 2